MGKLYKFSHSVGRGGWHVIVKTRNNERIFSSETIADKVKDALFGFKEKYKLRDVTVAVFPHHIHMIFGVNPKIAPQKFGEEVLMSLQELIKGELGYEDILDRDFYMAGTGGAEPEDVDAILKNLKSPDNYRRWFRE